MRNPLAEIIKERLRQDAKWGVQNHPDFTPNTLPGDDGFPLTDFLKDTCEHKGKHGNISYFDILMEEVGEARDEAVEGNVDALREELIQVAAVALAWIECIDRRVPNANQTTIAS